MTIDNFWEKAIEQNWYMTWSTWTRVINTFCETKIVDDDSGLDRDVVYPASIAREGFNRSTVLRKI